MNSRSSVNESNLVSFSPDLASLNALDKEPLLSFPFDHLYACHSESSDCGQSLTLDKNVEISTHCLVPPDQTILAKDAEIQSLKTQNKKLKDLLVYHLDLIQQQNDVITNREKSLNNVQDEVINLREKVGKQAVKQPASSKRVPLNPPPLFHVPSTCTVTAAAHSPLEPISLQPVLFNTIDELFASKPENSFFYNDRQKPFEHDVFDLGNPVTISDLEDFSIDNSALEPPLQDFSMIERPPVVKKEVLAAEPSPPPREPKYTVTTNSGMPIIQKVKNRKKSTGIGSLSRMPKTPKKEPSTIYDNEIYNVNKKTKSLSTYGKNNVIVTPNTTINITPTTQTTNPTTTSSMTNPALRYPLSGRLQLMEPTPTGLDPYEMSEAEMREQSPIPRLVMSNRVRVHTGQSNLTTPAPTTPRLIYDPDPEPETTQEPEPQPERKPKKNKKPSKVKANRRKSSNATPGRKASTIESQKIKKEDLDWEPPCKKPKQASLNDFSYGETSLNLAAAAASSGELVTSGRQLPSATISSSKLNLYSSCNIDKMQDINKMSYNEIFDQEPTGEDEIVQVTEPTFETEQLEPKTKKRCDRTISLAGSSTAGEEANPDVVRRSTESKRGGRKRALSSASSTKREKAPRKPRAQTTGRGRGGYRGKRGSWVPVAGLTTRTPYHTAMGHPDISWYLGHDPDVKKEDVEQLAENTSSIVEVPRWREMIFTSVDCAEGTENTDDDAYKKRHQKLEAEERRQLRWHMRRVREQRHVERLRLRQRDPWTVSTLQAPLTFSVWPSPLRDLQLIEITDIIPVLAFGEDIPKLPDHDFVLPWVRTSKAQKRSKRSKTLH